MILKQILVPISLFAFIFGAFYVYVTARYRIKMAMIERGMNPFEKESRKLNVLKYSLLLIGLSIGVIVGEAATHYLNWDFGGPSMPVCSALLFGGIALLIYYFLILKKEKE